ncbi:patatin-like phospholipase family protein [Anditalea andensis]|uniref:PNPLA domain-containing protein n=1 Tax=Anditalea andensis TaxID=1048983 RepID=A0A074KWZ8_9BACT|nr:patatin-like phospholipase family protein [Anditalea andensis]KEO72745.1 hypothetical protein EL17_18630 [Anditalea andensis]
MNNTNEFHIGLCLAGAISAGAYTAGVLDYLLEALDQWEELKKRKDIKGVPQHKVVISVIGGASAGGMTGMIMGIALNKKFDPIDELGKDETSILNDKPSNPLYHSWVDLLDAKDPARYPEMFDYLLDNGDIKSGEVKSLFNSFFIEEIANRTFKAPSAHPYYRSYVHKNLKVFATMTNVIGMEQIVEFKGDDEKNTLYHILDHKDYGCFTFSKDDVSDIKGWERVDYSNESVLERYKKIAMGTGAFPLGLAPVEVSRRSDILNRHAWLNYITNFGQRPIPGKDYITTVVDGGMINNEPFEKVREILDDLVGPGDNDNQDYAKFRSTILMVDPFPSQSIAIIPGKNIISTISNIISTLLNQVRVKPEHLAASLASDKAGQYIISPVRYVFGKNGEVKIKGDKAIACGSLDGFGGFLSKSFRIHDFYLGRANCEKFLRDHFTVPESEDNPIFKNGYAHLDSSEKPRFRSKTDPSPGLQIIPIFSTRDDKTPLPLWPQIDLKKVISYRDKIYNRTEKILLNIINFRKRDRFLLWAGGKLFINRRITDIILNGIIKSLKDHFQIKEP